MMPRKADLGLPRQCGCSLQKAKTYSHDNLKQILMRPGIGLDTDIDGLLRQQDRPAWRDSLDRTKSGNPSRDEH